MIKPDVMDGVPEEEGAYFVNDGEGWNIVEVMEYNNGDMRAYYPEIEYWWFEKESDDPKQRFNNQKWSERIEEPDM